MSVSEVAESENFLPLRRKWAEIPDFRIGYSDCDEHLDERHQIRDIFMSIKNGFYIRPEILAEKFFMVFD